MSLCLCLGYSQNSELPDQAKKKYKKASGYEREGKIDKAIKELDKLIEDYPEFIRAYQKIAKLHYSKGSKNKAIQFLNEAISKDSLNVTTNYFLANIYEDDKAYDKAAEYYKKAGTYEKFDKDKRSKFLELSKKCLFRDSLINNALDITISKMKGDINSESHEYLPIFTMDEQKVAFVRRVNGQEDILIAEKDSLGKYVVTNEYLPVNTPYNEGTHTISSDGKVLIYSSCGNRQTLGSCDLYFTFLSKNGWREPGSIGKRVNSVSWEAQPSLSADGKKLFFSSGRPGGEGGRDLYYSVLNDNMSWSTPVNLGETINTTGNEETPFIHADGLTLYFTSNGHPGMGKKDIFMSKYDETANTWGKPVNLGYPINTENDEGALTISLDGDTAFFASDQGESFSEKKKSLDILSFPLPERFKPEPVTYIRIKTKNNVGDIISNVDFDIISTKEQKILYSGITDEIGEAIFKINSGKNLNLTCHKEGYIFHSEFFELDTITRFIKPYELEIVLQHLEKEEEPKPVILKNIFFKSGSSELTPESNFELDQLFALLNEKEEVRIQITGHTDDVGEVADNQVLSLQRAESVKRALVKKGISATRIEARGKGELEPLISEITEEARKSNRRTEFLIID